MTFDQPNVLIDHVGHARLADFGFASVVRGMNSVLVTEVQGYTARWAAPEVLESGDKNTREADVFVFGMVVIEVHSSTTQRIMLDAEKLPVWLTSGPYLRSSLGRVRLASPPSQSPLRRSLTVNGRIAHKTKI